MEYTVVLLTLVALATANDLTIGHDGGRSIFNQRFDASAAIWKQVNHITVNATGNDVIKQVIVKDLREDKDGEAKIFDGGVGVKDVTIELKSPTVLRGYSFNVEVFAGKAEGSEGVYTESGKIPTLSGLDGEQKTTLLPDVKSSDITAKQGLESTTDKSRETREAQDSTVKSEVTIGENATVSVTTEEVTTLRSEEDKAVKTSDVAGTKGLESTTGNSRETRENQSTTDKSDVTTDEVTTEEVTTLRSGEDGLSSTTTEQSMGTSEATTQGNGGSKLYTNTPEDVKFNKGNLRRKRQIWSPFPIHMNEQSSQESSEELLGTTENLFETTTSASDMDQTSSSF